MNIAWLWHYTKTDNSESLRIKNEKNAFTVYARWRAIVRGIKRLYTSVQIYLLNRDTRRTLIALPDYLLTDIGMYRSGNEIKLEVAKQRVSMAGHSISPYRDSSYRDLLDPGSLDREKSQRCVVLPVQPCPRDLPARVSSDDASRAA